MITYYVKLFALLLLIATEGGTAGFGKNSSRRVKLLDDFVESILKMDGSEAEKHLKSLDKRALASKKYTVDLQHPLLIAIEKNAHNLVKIMMVEKRVEASVVDANKSNIFHYAAYYADVEMIQILTTPKTRPLVNKKNADGNRPLIMAVSPVENNRTVSEQCSVVRTMMLAGADPCARNSGKNTVLHAALNASVAKLFLDVGADANALNGANFTPIMSAIAAQRRDVVRLLLAREDVDVTIPDKRGRTPFHLTGVVWKEDIVKSLLAKGAPIDAADENGDTPLVKNLLYDVARGKERMKNPEYRKGLIYDYLMKAGANLGPSNKDGQSFLSLVRQHKIEGLLVTNHSDTEGSTVSEESIGSEESKKRECLTSLLDCIKRKHFK